MVATGRQRCTQFSNESYINHARLAIKGDLRMAQKRQNPAIFMAIAAAAIIACAVLLQTNQGLYDFFFKRETTITQLRVPKDQLESISDQIRDGKRGKWIEKVAHLQGLVAAMQEYRDDLFTTVTDIKGVDYLAELQRLSASEHVAIGQYDLQAEKVPLDHLYRAARDAELLVVNHYRDISAARNGMKANTPAADAVGWVKVVVPKRVTITADHLDAPVLSNSQLEYFKQALMTGESSFEAITRNVEVILEKVGVDANDEGSDGFETDALLNIAGSSAGETLQPDELELDAEAGGDDFGAMPGRIISSDAMRSHNIFIDRWYVMGPFENRGRANLDASFLPESIIDLDSTTIGKDGQEIGWEYWVQAQKANKPRIEPSFAERGSIYYGWSEVYVEEAGLYWIALGSDDYGKLWINKELTWKSGTRAKPYRPSEYLIEVELQQGVNEFLFRCENGGGTMGWSVIILTAIDDY